MPLDTEAFYDGSTNLDDARVDGVEDSEFYGSLNTERIIEAYQMQDAIETDDYETLAREVGYSGAPAADYAQMADRVKQRKAAEQMARDAFNNTEAEKRRTSFSDSLKDIPVLGWWAKLATDVEVQFSFSTQNLAQYFVDVLSILFLADLSLFPNFSFH